jgi:hypothetical protein
MTDLDLRLWDKLDALFPVPRRAAAWEDVLARARPPLLRRPLVLALAATALVLGSAAAVTAALGGFDAWLSGTPGEPASHEEQARFRATNGRTWGAFPRSTRLRELIRTNVGGRTYVLFGFRSGSTLCLKLKAVSLGHSTSPACVPVSTVVHAMAPIVPVVTESGFDDRHAHPSAQFSFGIAADGVSRVDVRTTDGAYRAAVGGNAYLFVANEPNTGSRVLAVSTRRADRNRTTIDLAPMFGDAISAAATPRPARGPARVQVKIRRPQIGWAVRGEKRGFSVDRLNLPLNDRGLVDDARFVKPDPYSDIVVGLAGTYCLAVVQGKSVGRGCSDRQDFFSRTPMNVMASGGGGVTATAIAGAVADGVVRVVAFGADGQRVAVPLRDNLFALRLATSDFPVRIVGYDRDGRVAAVETVPSLLRTPLPPQALRHLRAVLRVTGPTGATATLRVGPVARGLRCWRVDFTSAESRTGCTQTIATGPWTTAYLVQPAGHDLFVIGHVRAPVERVRLRFADGSSISARPTHGLFLLAIPRAHLSPHRQLAFALGLRRDGSVVQRQGVLFKLPR